MLVGADLDRAALYNLGLAIEVAGRTPSVWLLPGLPPEPQLLTTVAAERTLLASVEVMPGVATPPTAAEQELYEALWLSQPRGTVAVAAERMVRSRQSAHPRRHPRHHRDRSAR